MPIEITLAPELGKYVQEKIQSGEFASPSDLVVSALEIFREQEASRPEDIAELRRQIAVGIDAFRNGNYAPWNLEEMEAELAKKIAARS